MKNKNIRTVKTLRLCAFAVKSLVMLLGFAPFIISCQKENMGDCFKSTGDIAVEYRTVATFDTIEALDNINIFLTNDTFFEIRIEAGENLIPLIKTEVKNNKLSIRNDNKCNWVRSFSVPVNVYVTMPTPGAVYNEGIGVIKSLNTLTNRTMIIKMSNSGDVDLMLDIPHLLVNLAAAQGNLYLQGEANLFELFCIGTTILKAEHLITEKTFITTSGTGDMYVNASAEVGATITWIGNVYYTGTAIEAYANYSSTGRLIRL